MTVDEAIRALDGSGDSEFAVIVLRKERGGLLAAAVLGVAVDETGEDVSLVMGEFLEEDGAFDEAVPVGDVLAALTTVGERCAEWPVFSTGVDDPTRGGSLVGYSVDAELEVFAFLQGPRADWADD